GGEAPAPLSDRPSVATNRKWLILAAGLSMTIVIAIAWIAFRGGPPHPVHSMAVLPFVNLSDEAETGYFADGLTEQLIHALSGIEGLRVVAWTSAYQFQNTKKDISEIGALDSSMAHAGSDLAAHTDQP